MFVLHGCTQSSECVCGEALGGAVLCDQNYSTLFLANFFFSEEMNATLIIIGTCPNNIHHNPPTRVLPFKVLWWIVQSLSSKRMAVWRMWGQLHSPCLLLLPGMCCVWGLRLWVDKVYCCGFINSLLYHCDHIQNLSYVIITKRLCSNGTSNSSPHQLLSY